eukprot:scaffold143291_cov14-Tisochrysis_lutea.AAC.1
MVRQPSFWRSMAQPHQQHQHQSSSTASPADASSHLPSSVLPHTCLGPELRGLKLGKGSYKWGSGQDTEGEASSDDEVRSGGKVGSSDEVWHGWGRTKEKDQQ